MTPILVIRPAIANYVFRLLTVTTLFWSLPVKAADLCRSLLSPPDLFAAVEPARAVHNVKNPTVAHIGTFPIQNGGNLLSLQKIGNSWMSYFDPDQNGNHQGDPRLLAILLGTKGANFMGFRSVSDREILVPDSEALNFAIERLNKKLIAHGKEPVDVRFYKSDLKTPEGIERYFNEFEKNFALPAAKEGFYAIHDAAYHYASILVPPQLLKVHRARTKVLNSYLNHLVAATKNELPIFRQIILKVVHEARERHVSDTDTGNGNFGLFLARYIDNQITQERAASVLDSHVRWTLNQGGSADYLRLVIEKLNNGLVDNRQLDHQNVEKEAGLQLYQKIVADAKSYIQEHQENPDYKDDYKISAKEFLQASIERLEEIQEVLREE